MTPTPTETPEGWAVVNLRPCGAGVYSDWFTYGDSPGWKCVDENPGDEEDTYVYGDGEWVRYESFEIENIPVIETIENVRVYILGKIDGSEVGFIEMFIRAASGDKYFEQYGSGDLYYSDYHYRYAEYTDCPWTGQAWTKADIDELQAGFRGASYGDWIRVTQLYVEVQCFMATPTPTLTPTAPTPTPTISPTPTMTMPSPTPLWCPWPMFKHDPRRTGRSSLPGPQSVSFRWSFVTGDNVCGSPAIGPDGKIYAGSADARLYSLNAAGSLAWSYDILDSIWVSPAIDPAGRIYVESLNHGMYAFTVDGSLSWSYSTYIPDGVSPLLWPDGKVTSGFGPSGIITFDASSAPLWSFNLHADYISSPSLGLNNEVYMATAKADGPDGNVWCFDSAGALAWTYDLGAYSASAPAVSEYGTLHVLSWSSIQALYPTGSLKWSYSLMGEGPLWGSPALDMSGRVFACSASGRFFAFNDLGALQWSYRVGGSSDAPAVASDDMVYLGAGPLYAFNGAGRLRWSYRSPESMGSPSLGEDRSIYVGSWDNRIYAFRDLNFYPTAAPTLTPVPPTITRTPTVTPTVPPPTAAPTDTPTPVPTPTPGATPVPLGLRINYQPSESESPSGYLADYGEEYTDRGGFHYGWR